MYKMKSWLKKWKKVQNTKLLNGIHCPAFLLLFALCVSANDVSPCEKDTFCISLQLQWQVAVLSLVLLSLTGSFNFRIAQSNTN